MPRDKNPSLAKTCLICRQKVINQIKVNAVVNLEVDQNLKDSEGVEGSRESENASKTVSKWKALCLESFSMLFELPVNHPLLSVFLNNRGGRGQMCNRCMQDVSNVNFVLWQLQSLEKKLCQLRTLIFDRLRSNYEALPVGLIFGKYMGAEELRKDFLSLSYDEIVKILFEEIKSTKESWSKPSLGSRWQEACQNSEEISKQFPDLPQNAEETESFAAMLPDLPGDHLDSYQVKIEVDATPDLQPPVENVDFSQEDDTSVPPTPTDTSITSPVQKTSKRASKRRIRFICDEEENESLDNDVLDLEDDLLDDDDDEWIDKRPKKRSGKTKKSPSPVKSKSIKVKEKKSVIKPPPDKKTEESNTRFLCTEDPESCSRTYGSKKHLKGHIDKYHKGRVIVCDEDGCTAKFKNDSALEKHQVKVHDKQRPKEICELCGLEVPHKEMKKHYYFKHHGVGKFKCDQCSMDFVEQDDFTNHEQLHQSAEYPFLCVVCQQLFTNSMDLKNHVASNHLSSGLKCAICGVMKPNEFLLQRHLKIHERRKQFVCTECGRAFSTQAYLNYHEDHYHKNADRVYPCEICGKEFKHEKNVVRHLISHREEKPHKCKICQKTFNYSHLLKKHEEIHSGTRSYECELCGKRFRQEQNLRQHMKSHRPKPEKSGRKRAVKVEEEEEPVGEISYEIHQDEGDKDAIPVILQVKGDIGDISGITNHHMITATSSASQLGGLGGENVIEATIIPAADMGEDELGNPTGQYETVQEIQLHHSQDLSQSQTATVVFLYEYQT